MGDEDGSALTPLINLPEGAIFAGAITAVSYIDAEGHAMYMIARSGTSSFLQSLGLLEAAKYALIQENEGKN